MFRQRWAIEGICCAPVWFAIDVTIILVESWNTSSSDQIIFKIYDLGRHSLAERAMLFSEVVSSM